MTDSHCVRCHQELQSTKFEKKITGFNIDHPEFKSIDLPIDKRPSTIKFSHARHLTLGMVFTEGANGAFTLGKIPAPLREKYRTANQLDSDAVLLDCKSCHSLDAAPRSDGRYFAPIKFEESCKACHATETGPVKRVVNEKEIEVVKSMPVPHGMNIDKLKEFSRLLYYSNLQIEHNEVFATPNPFDPKRKDEPAVVAFNNDVQRETDRATRFLELQCQKCHIYEGKEIKPSAIPSAWLAHAMFDHASHRGAECKSCHPNAVARFVGNETDYEREKVNILGIESCKQCHAPETYFGKRTQGSGVTHGGVRHGCTDCHRFHGGDQPMHGRGSPMWTPAPRKSIDDLLKGEK